MSAGASPTKSPEPPHYNLPRSLRRSPRCPLSLLFSLQKPEIVPKRVLLLASEAIFESEVREALERQLQSRGSCTCVDQVYLDLTSLGPGFTCIHQAQFTSYHLRLPGLALATPAFQVNNHFGLARPHTASHHLHQLKTKRFALPTLFWRYWPGVPSKRHNAYTKPLV